MSLRKIRVAMVGTGSFAQCFIPLFKAHPLVEEVVLCDLDPEKLHSSAKEFHIERCLPSLDAVCESDVDAAVIITQHWMHGPQAVQALEAGKHVYSAVPSAISMEEITQLVRTVERTRRIYMIGETSYYYPEAIYCRERFRNGDFGHIVYGEGEYMHDWDHGGYAVGEWRGGKDWRKNSGEPTFFYPTHSTSLIVSVTGAHATHVSGHGFADTREADRDIYRPDNNYQNVFSNETALLKMSDGSSARINEFRRIGHLDTVRMNLFGTEGSFEKNAIGAVWLTKEHKDTQRLDDLIGCEKTRDVVIENATSSEVDLGDLYDTYHNVAKIHPLHRLPREFAGLPNGHRGSHQFLVDDFVISCVNNSLPPNNVWQAARYLVPGLVAHESAKQGGKLLPVPDFDDAPAQWP